MVGTEDEPPSGYLPALDGLRALAVVAVVAYHLDPGAVRGGYLGVDLFFVLSGFLITRLLLSERRETGGIDLASFLARRARRLLPGLVLLLASLGVVARLDPGLVNPAELRGDGLSALFYVANWHFLQAGQSYFGALAARSPLEHTWSLGVEEQFYLVWPLLLLGLAAVFARRSSRGLLLPVGLVAAASALGMALVYDGGRGLDAAYFGTECRAFELLSGALVAIWLESRAVLPGGRRGRPLPAVVGPVCLGTVLAALVALRPGALVFDGGLALVAASASFLVVAAVGPGPVRSLLAAPPLRLLGRASYEVYLWHWPVIVLGDQAFGLRGAERVLVDVAITLVLASVSYAFVDAPLRRARFSRPIGRAVLPVSFALVASVLVAVPLGMVGGALSAARLLGRSAAPGRSGTSVFGVHLPAPSGRIDLGARPSPRHPVRVMFIGDSVMYQLELAIGAGLAATGEGRTAVDGAILGWSPRGRSDFAELAGEIARAHPEVVVAMWTQDNRWVQRHGVAAYETHVLGPLLSLLLARGDGVRGVVFAGQPPQPPSHSWMPDVHADVYAPRGMMMWQQAVTDESRRLPGRVAFAPATAMLEFAGRYATWLPSPGGRLARVRQLDDFHLCVNGGVRYGAGVVEGLVRLLGLPPPKANWWLGSFAAARRWSQLPGYPSGMCPNDPPPRLTPGNAEDQTT
ncbi:MAG TPA: acyltransferase [Acidimicrobiales bacterium]|nr:acyltransferase [Acidimicrobiales bacterium]